jgi:hypothetical protein
MQNILIYDYEADKLEKTADDNDISVAELMEMLIEFIDDCKEAYGLK